MLLFSVLWGCLLPSFGQETFKIDDFSDKYYGKAFISDKSKPYCGGWVAVFDRKTNKELIRVDADELSYELHDNRMRANIAEGPYGEHSVLFYGDFNFDGVKDFALMDGLHGWNHTPSFKIYLASGKGFKFSSEFSRLTHENCGIFTVDEENNTVKTLTRGAGAWSEVSTYIPQFGLRSPPFYSDYSPQRFFRPCFRPKIYCFTQVNLEKRELFHFCFSLICNVLELVDNFGFLIYFFFDKFIC